MKRQRKMVQILFVVLFFLLGLFQGPVQAAATWSFVDGGAATGINYNTSNNAVNPVMAVYNNELYVVWTENNGSATLIRVKKYNGSSWSNVTGANGLNKDPTRNSSNPTLVIFNGNLYAAWEEYTTDGSGYIYTAIRVRRYDGGTTWTQVDGDANQGLNRVATPASNPAMTVYNGELYIAWSQIISSVSYIHVKKYVNGTTWSFVDGNTDLGLNHDATRNGLYPNLTVCNNQLYLAWTEINSGSIQQIRVTQYNGGSSWSFIDGNGVNGLNLSSSYQANASWLMSLNNTLYAAWDEPDGLGNEQAHLKRYNGSNVWTFVDNGYLNRMADLYAYSPRMTVWNNKAYIAWDEEDQNPSFIQQIRVKQYDGSSFSFVDGGLPASQLNKDNTKTAKTPFPVVFNGDLYVAWYELNGTLNQIRVKKYSLPPIVNSVTVPSNGSYYVGQSLDFTVNFSKAVNVNGTPVIPITLNSGSVNAAYLSGSGTTALTFRYTVVSGNLDNNGITLGSAIALSGGTISEPLNSLDAEISLNNVASSSGILVDAVAPTVFSVGVPVNTTYTAGQNLTFTVNFSEAVTVVTTGGTPYIPITLNTGSTVNASYLSGSGTTALEFRYTVVSGNNDNDGIAVGAAITANGGTLKDATGNDAVLTLTSVGSTTGVLVDAVAPTIIQTTTASNSTNTSPIPVTITFSEAVTGFVAGDITVTNGTASNFAGSGMAYTVNITPAGQGTVTVNVAGGVANDAAGNGNTAATALSRTYDNQAPAVIITTTAGNPTNTSPIPVTITFSETVTGFIVGDITVTNGTAGNFSGSGMTYTVNITPSVSGAVTVNITDGVAQDSAGNNNTAATVLSMMYILVPSTPTLVLPVDIAPDQPLSVSLIWNKVSGASSYRIQLSTSSVFSALIIDDSLLTDSIKNTGTLQTSTTYYWRVRAKNTGGISAWSNSKSFTTVPPVPSEPILAFPVNNTTYLPRNLTFSWKGSSGTPTYRFQLSTSSDFSSLVIDDSLLTVDSLSVSSLLPNTKYYWRVNARNAGGISTWPPAYSFTTVPSAPSAPVLVSPSDYATEQPLNLSFKWNKSSFASNYRIQIATKTDFSTIVFDDSLSTDTTRYASSLSANSTYFWRVNAKNSEGVSAWSDTRNFSTVTVPVIVLLNYPAHDEILNTDSVQLIWWKGTSNVIRYQVDIASDSLFVNGSTDSVISDTSKIIRNLANKTKYWWRVRADYITGWGPFSISGSFSINRPANKIVITGLSDSDQVYLGATQGWYGTFLNNGNDTIKDLSPGYYYLSFRAPGKRPQIIQTFVPTDHDTSIAVTMKSAVALMFEDTAKMEQRPGVPMSLGSAASVVMDDIDSDGTKDIIAAYNDGSIDIYLYKSGEYTFEKHLLLGNGVLRCIRVLDFKFDGKPDLALAFEDGTVSLYSQQSNLTFSFEVNQLQTEDGLSAFDIEDFDYDGNPEFALGFTDGTVKIAKSNGTSYTVNSVMLDSGTPCNIGNVTGIEALDISGDGYADILAGKSDGTFKWFRNNGSGVFTAMGNLVSNGKPLSPGTSSTISSLYGEKEKLPSLLITNEAGMVYTVPGKLQADFNGDGEVNLVDFGTFVDAWRAKEGDSNWNANVNMDLTPDPVSVLQIINLSDFGKFVDVWRNKQ
jgi:hypothetical protein